MPYPVEDFYVQAHIPNATDATNQIPFIAPYDVKVVSVRTRHRVASTSGTMDVVKAADGTAVSGGTSVLTTPMLNSGTANTNVLGSLLTTIGGTTIPKGSSLGLVFAGTLTNLVDLDVIIHLRQQKRY